jgi:hypothetical protein
VTDNEVFAFIAVALRMTANRWMIEGGLNASTIPRRDINKEVATLVKDEFSYENFWRLIARPGCQVDGGWHTSNHWAMKKLGVYDELQGHRKYHYNHLKLRQIKSDTGKSFYLSIG